MLTNIDIDQDKINRILSMHKYKSKKEVVDEALKLLSRKLAAEAVLKMKGSNCWEGDLDQMRSD
jgi:Arc/MetJ family transcription regulator